MQIRKLEIQGFKSFADRTAFHFGPGISGVVGSNGCGKSNVVDAVKWCLGEQSAKSLRGQNMGDVIFNGTQQRPATSLAEVSLSFVAGDEPFPGEFARYDEVQITRRLFRDGSSEYLINQQKCRLRDIQDLFLDTGVNNRMYSFIEQGRIGQIVNARPEQRRALFEEAAGISRYKARRDEAVEKLAETAVNLERAADIVDDLDKRLRALGKQVERAGRYRRLQSRLKQAEVFLSLARFAALVGDRRELEEALQAAIAEEGGLDRALTRREEEIQQRRAGLRVLETGVGRQRDELAELEATRREQESARQYQSRELGTLQGRSSALEAGLQEQQEALEIAAEEGETVGVERATVEERLRSLEAALGVARGQLTALDTASRQHSQALDTVKQEQLKLVSRISGHKAALESASDRRFELDRRRVRLQERQQESQGQSEALALQLEESVQAAEEAEGAAAGITAQVESARAALGRAEQARAESQQARRAAEKDLARVEREEMALRTRLESLHALHSAHEGVEADVRGALKLPGVLGTLAEHLDVPVELEVPLAAALGPALDAILAEDDAAALRAAGATRGRALIFSLAGSGDGTEVVEGLAAHIGGTSVGRRALAGLLGVCHRTGSLAEALALHRRTGQAAVVSGTGRVFAAVSARGELVVGEPRAAGTAILARRRQIAELEQQVARAAEATAVVRARVEGATEDTVRVEDAVEDAREAVEAVRAQGAEVELRLRDARQRRSELQREQQRQVASEQRLSAEAREVEQALRAHDDQVRRREDAIAEDMERQEEVEDELRTHQRAFVEVTEATAGAREQMNRLAQETAGLRERLVGLRRAETAARTAAEAAARQLESAQRELKAATARMAELREDDVRLAASLQEIGERQGTLREELEVARSRVKSERDELTQQEGVLRDTRVRLESARKSRIEVNQQLTQVSVEIKRIHESLEEKHQLTAAELLARIERDGHVTLAADPAARTQDLPGAPPLGPQELAMLEDLRITEEMLQDREQIQAWVATLEGDRGALQRLGEVNLIAVQEYTEVAERHAALRAQREDLEASVRTIEQTIARLNRTCRERFRETFDTVNEHFQEVYPRLVGGGQARLELTDEEDLLETGVEIFAQPPGKRLQSLSLLSGGETAMVAIALIFSLFRVKPSPFCLLDEVDAPLDEGNGARFNRMLQEMAVRSQFIVITHNKKTMECADTLYGVTMDPPGISTIISVSLD